MDSPDVSVTRTARRSKPSFNSSTGAMNRYTSVLPSRSPIHASAARPDEHRARQNVLVELGYFLGRHARRHRRMILLCANGVVIPSDLHGLGCIEIADDLAPAVDAIRRELAARRRSVVT
jgi:hypothetical protein